MSKLDIILIARTAPDDVVKQQIVLLIKDLYRQAEQSPAGTIKSEFFRELDELCA